jgi:hypothetical protein
MPMAILSLDGQRDCLAATCSEKKTDCRALRFVFLARGLYPVKTKLRLFRDPVAELGGCLLRNKLKR